MTFFWQNALPNPAPNEAQDYNIYINFVLYSVLGKTAVADEMMRRYGDGIRRVAARLRMKRPVPKRRLYRGILVEPSKVNGGKIRPDPKLKFISWSEDLEVACWFADPDSAMSAFMQTIRPGVEGFIVTTEQAPAPVLFYYEWARGFELAGHQVDLAKLALVHPDMGADGYSQIRWALNTQREVITENIDKSFEAAPMDSFECPRTGVLDATLTWPGAR